MMPGSLFRTGVTMKKKVNPSMQTLVGIVTPFAWDERDQVSEVSLSATDEPA